MDHGAVIRTKGRGARRLATILLTQLALVALLALPTSAGAAGAWPLLTLCILVRETSPQAACHAASPPVE